MPVPGQRSQRPAARAVVVHEARAGDRGRDATGGVGEEVDGPGPGGGGVGFVQDVPEGDRCRAAVIGVDVDPAAHSGCVKGQAAAGDGNSGIHGLSQRGDAAAGRGRVSRQGAGIDRERAGVVDAAAAVDGRVVADEAALHGQRAAVEDAAAVGGPVPAECCVVDGQPAAVVNAAAGFAVRAAAAGAVADRQIAQADGGARRDGEDGVGVVAGQREVRAVDEEFASGGVVQRGQEAGQGDVGRQGDGVAAGAGSVYSLDGGDEFSLCPGGGIGRPRTRRTD